MCILYTFPFLLLAHAVNLKDELYHFLNSSFTEFKYFVGNAHLSVLVVIPALVDVHTCLVMT